MLEKIWAGMGLVAIAVCASVVVGLMVHLIRYAWSAF